MSDWALILCVDLYWITALHSHMLTVDHDEFQVEIKKSASLHVFHLQTAKRNDNFLRFRESFLHAFKMDSFSYRHRGWRWICLWQVFIFANMAATSRMEEYFPRPLEYHPERWLRDDRAQWSTSWPRDSAFLSLPFSHGLRACPGKRFAEQGLYAAIISVCYFWF